MHDTGPTGRARETAGRLQSLVISDDYRQLDEALDDYSSTRANQAAIHARQDLVLVFSMMCSMHDRAVNTNRLLFVCALLLLMILIAVLR